MTGRVQMQRFQINYVLSHQRFKSNQWGERKNSFAANQYATMISSSQTSSNLLDTSSSGQEIQTVSSKTVGGIQIRIWRLYCCEAAAKKQYFGRISFHM
jgi:hypothetical protein